MSRRVPAVAAITFAVLYAVALVMAPPLPGVNQPGTVVVEYFSSHAGAIRGQALLLTLGSLALVVVLGYARTRLDGPPGYVFTIGSALVLAQISIAMWFTSGLAVHAGKLDALTGRGIADVASMWGPILTAADVMVAVPIVLAAINGRFPRWLGLLAAVFAVEQLVEMATIVAAPGSFFSPGGPMNIYVGGTLFVVFFLALGLACAVTPAYSGRGKMESPSSGVPSI
jgi:hypothetical protein